MNSSEEKVLGDKDIFPSEELIFSIIGEKKALWQKIMNYCMSAYSDTTGEWRYYNDGKQWLFKLTRKKKTIFWLALTGDDFRITFYFGNKAEPVILSSDIPEDARNEFLNGPRFGNIRPITTTIRNESDVTRIIKIIDLKVKIK